MPVPLLPLGEGLDAFCRLRAAMVDELGIEPSRRLQRLHHAVLRDDRAGLGLRWIWLPFWPEASRSGPQGLGSRRAREGCGGDLVLATRRPTVPDLRHRSTHALWEPPRQSPHVLYSAASSTAGPRWTSSRRHYAKGGLIDDRAPVTAVSRVRISSPATVWRLLRPAGLALLGAGGHLRAAGTEGHRAGRAVPLEAGRDAHQVDAGRGRTAAGVVLDRRARRTRAVHRFRLTTVDGGHATDVLSEESIGGPLIALTFPVPKLRTVLQDWLEALRTTAGDRRDG